MRQIAKILGCPFYLNILVEDEDYGKSAKKEKSQNEDTEKEDIPSPREITVGDLLDLAEVREQEELEREEQEDGQTEDEAEAVNEEGILGEINPYTRREYESNSVRTHPKHIGYVQVYDREEHKWTDMTEWAFLGEQERKKRLLGRKYKPPVYLD